MNIEQLINSLKKLTGFGIECPHCLQTTSCKKIELFTQASLSPSALIFKSEFLEENQRIKNRISDFKTVKLPRLAKTTHSVNVGKIIEKFAPVLRGFDYDASECKGLFEPIDYIVFKGSRQNKITHIEFIDVKSGNASLKQSQRQIRDVVQSGNVRLQVIGDTK